MNTKATRSTPRTPGLRARTLGRRCGVTLVEYALMLAMIGVVLIVVASMVGQRIKTMFSRANGALNSSTGGTVTSTSTGTTNVTPSGNNGNSGNSNHGHGHVPGHGNGNGNQGNGNGNGGSAGGN